MCTERNIVIQVETSTRGVQIAANLLRNITGKVIFLAPTRRLYLKHLEILQKYVELIKDFLHDEYFLSRSIQEWAVVWEKYQVFLMTPQLLLVALQHGYLHLDEISLLVFSEFQLCVGNSAYARIIKQYYVESIMKPRILCYTTIPLKFANLGDILGILDVEKPAIESEQHSNGQKEIIVNYCNIKDKETIFSSDLSDILKDIASYAVNIPGPELISDIPEGTTHYEANECYELNDSILNIGDFSRRRLLKQIQKEMNGIKFVNATLGSLPAKLYGKSYLERLNGHESEHITIDYDPRQVSEKVDILIQLILDQVGSEVGQMKQCLILVDRSIVAHTLAELLSTIDSLKALVCGYAFGQHTLDKMQPPECRQFQVEENISSFCSGDLNILVCTNTIIEHIDFPPCDLIVAFDPLRTKSSKHRFRTLGNNPSSTLAVMIESELSNHQRKFLDNSKSPYESRPKRMKPENDFELLLSGFYDPCLNSRKGATLYPSGSVPLLNWFAILNEYIIEYELVWPSSTSTWSEIYQKLKNNWKAVCYDFQELEILDEVGKDGPTNGYLYSVVIDGLATVNGVFGSLRRTKRAAKSVASFFACKSLYENHLLNEHFIPKEISHEFPDSSSRFLVGDGNYESSMAAIEVVESWVPICFRPPFEIENLFLNIIVIDDREIGIITSGILSYESSSFDFGGSPGAFSVYCGRIPMNMDKRDYLAVLELQGYLWEAAFHEKVHANSGIEFSVGECIYLVVPTSNQIIEWNFILDGFKNQPSDSRSRFIEAVRLLPEIIQKLNVICRAQDTMNILNSKIIPISDILPAFYDVSAECGQSYERLEILGDSFLKFASTVYLMSSKPKYTVGNYTRSRSKIISNENLSTLCIDLGLSGMLEFCKFSIEEWRPPIVNAGYHALSICRKKLADFLEALIGAYYHSMGLDGAWAILEALGIVYAPKGKIEFVADVNLFLGEDDVEKLEKTLGYEFKDKNIIAACFSDSESNFEKLEFLGDAILDFCMLEYFYNKYPELQPGDLATLKSSSVNNEFLGFACVQLGIHEYLSPIFKDNDLERYVSERGDIYERDHEAPKVLADILEAIFGAIFVDSEEDFQLTCSKVLNLLGSLIDEYSTPDVIQRCPMRMLNESLQALGQNFQNSIEYQYSLLTSYEERGGSIFCSVYYQGNLISKAQGNTTKTSKRRAARSAAAYIQRQLI